MPDTAHSFPDVPAHVPAELVHVFTHGDEPGYEKDPFAVLAKLADVPPLFFNPASPFGTLHGSWTVTSADYVREVLQNYDPFTNAERYGGDNVSWPRKALPLELDPPDHNKYRALIAPLFSPRSIDALEAQVHEVSSQLIDELVPRGGCDFMHDFSRTFPGTIFMILMGLPLEMKERFFDWEEKFFHDGTDEEKQQVGLEIFAYLQTLIEEKRKNPANDLVSLLTQSKIDGKPMPQEDIEDFCFLLYIAGLDTVNSGLGHIFRWLAEHPETQDRLIADPDLIPGFVEEMLRYHSWVHTTRVLSRDHDFHGVQMKKGDRIDCLATNASWDPKEFENPDVVDITREPNPHFAFAAGPHRCAGSHLARRELRVAVREWLERIGPFRLQGGTAPRYFKDGMIALRSLPLEWDRR